jgi:hypothetical protein
MLAAVAALLTALTALPSAGHGARAGREEAPFDVGEKVQTIFYADASRIRLGDYFRLDARRKDVQGFEPGPYMHFWNVWLDKR